MQSFLRTLVFVLTLFEYSYAFFGMGNDKKVKIDKFEGVCPEFKKLPIVYTQMNIAPNDEGQLLLNMTIVVSEDVPGPLRMEMKIEHCEQNIKNSCEPFHVLRNRHYCDMILSETDFTWRPFFQSIKPKWQCPIKKGTYKAVNGAFDISTILLMASENSHWKIRSESFDSSGKTVLCIQGEGHVEI